MDYLSEFQQQGFVHFQAAPEFGLIQFKSDLFCASGHQVSLLVYAPDQAALSTQVMPLLETALGSIEQMSAHLNQPERDLIQIILFNQSLGLAFRSESDQAQIPSDHSTTTIASQDQNTAIFKYLEQWTFDQYGNIFS